MSNDVESVTIESLSIYHRSQVEEGGTAFFLGRKHDDGSKVLGVRGDSSGFVGTVDATSSVMLCPLTAANAEALRTRLPWLRPVLLGLKTSAGFGDRLGLATPGHIRSICETAAATELIAPVFAQQSVRENTRTGRTPQQVMDDAMWGVFQEGWCAPWGADADHLKTPEDVEAFAEAGYTFFTIDPGDHVDDSVEDLSSNELEVRFRTAPWQMLEDSPADLQRRYLARSLDLPDLDITIDREQLLRAVAKYGAAVAHTGVMYRHLVNTMGEDNFELEVSVDETERPTTVVEHIYIASELRRLGVRWVSLAPRFIGSFEKGVDYIGDLEVFSSEYARHAAVARALGPYKLSLHSGSDKFSIYPIAARHSWVRGAGPAGTMVHLKTAGTSYLEALRAMSRVGTELFRAILDHAIDRYEIDRATYHVSAELARVPNPRTVKDNDLPDLLEDFDAREVLHVTFGSGLERFGDRLRSALEDNEDLYSEVLATHFKKHLEPFVKSQSEGS
ncbi:MAG: tagaturonate epimerase family protein [Acidobacteriota bacterium]